MRANGTSRQSHPLRHCDEIHCAGELFNKRILAGPGSRVGGPYEAEKVSGPGELEDRNARNNIAAGGIVLPEQTRTNLEKLGVGVGVSAMF
ncbi:hypothetical protein ACQI4F_15060 [Mycolicibacterium vaccae]|uniref:hypothetical protein n=1 Tax=Mycolicibacterium vaccae TaxID=1810 RepID=UPI003CECC572